MKTLLTKREEEVLRCLINGDSNPQIAQKLIISNSTAKAHVSNIFYKLHAKNRVEAIITAIKTDLISI